MKTKPLTFLLALIILSVYISFSTSLPDRFEENLNKGLKYYEGLGVQQDHKEAMKWFKLALVEEEYSRELPERAFMGDGGCFTSLSDAEIGQRQRLGHDGLVQISENALGEIYEQSSDIPFGVSRLSRGRQKVVQQNYEEAVKWYGRALSKEYSPNSNSWQDCWDVMTYPKAHYNLGRMYVEGLGLPEDNHKVFLLLHFAHDIWSAYAQYAQNRSLDFGGKLVGQYDNSRQYFYHLDIADHHSMEDAKHRMDLIAKELESYPGEMNAYTELHLEDSRYFQRMLAEDKK